MKIEELAARVIPEDGSVPDEALAKFENALGYVFPDDYRLFLQLSGGGGRLALSGLEYVEFKNGKMVYALDTFCRPDGNGCRSIQPLGMHFSEMGREVDGVPDGIFTIGDDGCGNIFTIDLRSSSFGSIGFVDHETFGDHFEDEETYEIMADSFSKFVERCRIKREFRVLTLGAGAPIEISDAFEIGPYIVEASRTREKARISDDTGAWMEFQPIRDGGHVRRTYHGSAATWQGYYDSPKSGAQRRSLMRVLFGSDVTVIGIDHIVSLFEDFLRSKSSDLDIRWKQLP